MKLLELEINNVRGIRYMLLKPQGKNLLVVGPNGVGKSSIVDAIDFLLTGSIARLTGAGTKNISLTNAGPRLGCNPEQATVKATISVDEGKTKITFGRCMADAQTVICDEKDRCTLDPLLAVTGKGQTILTRRNILQYIAETPGDRAAQIYALLNLRDIESLRKTLVETANKCNKELEMAKAIEQNAVQSLLSTVGQTVLDLEKVRDYANLQRASLEASPLASVHSVGLKDGVVPPSGPAPKTVVDWNEVRSTAASLMELLQSVPPALEKDTGDFNTIIQQLLSTKQMSANAKEVQLTKLGLEVLGEGDSCPLCETVWPHGKLRTALTERIQYASIQSDRLGQLDSIYNQLKDSVVKLYASCEHFLKLTAPIAASSCATTFRQYMAQLTSLVSHVTEAHEKLSSLEPINRETNAFMNTSDLKKYMEEFLTKTTSNNYVASPTQIAWDRLTRLEQSLESREKAKATSEHAYLANLRSQSLLKSFVASKDGVLNELYQGVQNRFVEFYRCLHTSNEPKFTATLQSNNAGLELAVDFLGKKMAPPLAYHSEGHQDSMGICLYLALAEHLSMSKVKLTVLDDVVMSVDTDHRRDLCALLRDQFPDQQFIMTTHDRAWAMQLQSTGTVAQKNCTQLTKWTLETGPYDGPLDDLWLIIEKALAVGDVRGAAPMLRRGAEEFLQTVCDALHASVVFKRNPNYDLGELRPAALKQYEFLLRRARASAQSWNKPELVAVVGELDSIRASVSKRVQEEQGNINPVVHYNEWADLSTNDFRPVVAAYHDLYDLFFCPTCGSVVQVLPALGAPQSLRCQCCKTNLNLAPKV